MSCCSIIYAFASLNSVTYSFRSHYIQELLLATTHEISQIVINEPPLLTANPETREAEMGSLNMEENVEQHGAEAVFVEEMPVGAEAMKKSFIRKKELPAEVEGNKKQKSKVANVRK